MNFGSYWFSDKIVLKMYRAKEVNRESAPKFYDMIERLARQANLPMPKVYIINDPTPNAFATGRSPKKAAVAATTGILQGLSNDELAGVMAHELAHVKNQRYINQHNCCNFSWFNFIHCSNGWLDFYVWQK